MNIKLKEITLRELIKGYGDIGLDLYKKLK